MKFKTNKLSFNFTITSVLLLVSPPILAVTGDTEQPIYIASDSQSFDIQRNIVTCTGNVVITQGTIKINADRVVATRLGGEKGKESIDGYGNPATFYQMQDNGKPVQGRSIHMHYELAKVLVNLTGNAYLEQLDSNISADKITYLVKEQKMQSYSKKGKRVTTVLLPSQFQNKNKNQASVQKKVTNSSWQP